MSTRPLPQPPFHLIPGLPNFRDAGGYALAADPSRAVRRGLVFRSSEPSRLTPEGEAALRDLGIRKVYDMRSRVEIERAVAKARAAGSGDGDGGAIREWEGAERLFVPVFLDEDYSPEAIALRFSHYASEGTEGFTQAYKAMLVAGSAPDHPSPPFATVFTHLASPEPPAPILVHCTAGKDRTGVLCALILSLCGVADELVAQEYSLTDVGLRDRMPEFAARLAEHPALGGDLARVQRMLASKKENMLNTLDMVRREYGSVEGFVIEKCGLSEESVRRIRENLIVESSSVGNTLDLDVVLGNL